MRYEDHLKGRPTATQLKTVWNTIGDHLGHYHPLNVDDTAVAGYLQKRREQFLKRYGREVSDGTLYNEVNVLQSVLNFAKKKRIIIEDPHKLTKPTKPDPVDRWLNHDEINLLLNESMQTPHLYVAVVLMLSTAGRIGAILDLTWDRVDMENKEINLKLKGAGTRKNRANVPMNNGTYELLREWRTTCTSDYVVEFKSGRVHSIQNSFKKAVKRAKLENVTPHVLRHTAAVHMVVAGCSMSKVSQYLGHSSIKVTESVYARFAPSHLREESEAVDFTIGRSIPLLSPAFTD